jgi:hypothetical protein
MNEQGSSTCGSLGANLLSDPFPSCLSPLEARMQAEAEGLALTEEKWRSHIFSLWVSV